MTLFQSLLSCLFGSNFDSAYEPRRSSAADAATIVDLIYSLEKTGIESRDQIHTTLHAYNWTEGLARAVLSALEAAVRQGRAMSPVVKAAFDKALDAAGKVGGFVEAHPVFCTVIVLGMLVVLMPWAIEALGFAAEGPVEGWSRERNASFIVSF